MIDIVNDVWKGRRDYLLTHGALSKRPDRGKNEKVNIPCFREDLGRGLLSDYQGEWVVYHKGVLCGVSTDGKELYETAIEYYGSTNLAVFRVPRSGENLEKMFDDAQGQF
ncbi:hypothetical protein HYT55_03180 [Candidatus Woesearchaeota archaeon]|nr:hypothetical protein [Candidatus Woesearchaeota archaeon]